MNLWFIMLNKFSKHNFLLYIFKAKVNSRFEHLKNMFKIIDFLLNHRLNSVAFLKIIAMVRLVAKDRCRFIPLALAFM